MPFDSPQDIFDTNELLGLSAQDQDDPLEPVQPMQALQAMQPVQPMKAKVPSIPEFREFGDTRATRKNIYDQVLAATQGVAPVSNQLHTLRLSGVEYIDPDSYSKKDQKQAILSGGSKGRRMRGTWELVDNTTGDVLDSKQQVIASVPYLSDRGTFINNGTEYSLRNQQRLRPGVYTRIKENGEIESHANVLPGKGVSHRYFLDPEKGVFYMRFGQAKLPLMPLIKAMGVPSQQIKEAWGPDLYAANYAADDAAAYKKIKEKVLKPADREGDDNETQREKLVRRFAEMELDPTVTQRTLGSPHTGLTPDAIMDITKKLVSVSRGESPVDDRDALPYQTIMGPEDLYSERIARDSGNARRQLLWKMSGKGNLQGMPSSALKSQLESALLGSGLGQALEEVNPAEMLDQLYSISRMGEGGIPSNDAVPDEARNVQSSHMGFIDSLRTPESFKVGVDLFMARNSRKGKDGMIYTRLKDAKTGDLVWRSPQDVADMAVTFPTALEKYHDFKRVPAMQKGELTWTNRNDIDYIIPDFEGSFSPLANMVPMKSMVKGQRVAMASRMATQALPLQDAEAPLVQSALPGTKGERSYEEEYAKHMGATHAEKGGQVLSVGPEGIKVRYDDGTTEEHELYDNLPFNRKTLLYQTPVVKPGDTFKPGQLLAKSNYTDGTGATALGKNFRVAYVPWQGKNFEDAVVISESAAKRLTSEHMHQHELELDDKTKVSRRHFISMFPGKFDKATLAKLDERGIVRPGTEVQTGDPLILATKQRELADNKIHKRKQAGYNDASVTWEHNDPGVVTDVVDGKNGPVVVVKSFSSMKVGDKMSGRYGDKGVVADIIPDSQMPHDGEGNPFELLLNPLGIVSRVNPAQILEAKLGKLAQKLGRPIKVEDFDDSRDMVEWASDLLKRHDISDTDDILDPNSERKIPGIFTGSRFMMKLHHTSENKGQARGSGAYTMDDEPAKGGETGSKRISLLDSNALLAHGATETLRDAGAIRGQRSEDWWLQFMQGYTPKAPKVPMVYQKFVNQLKASGINVINKGTQTNVMALTDKDVNTLAGDRLITNGESVRWDHRLRPIDGGLFDEKLTGGHGGTKWSAIQLHEPMPNPVMEEPIRRMLGLTQKQFEGVISGAEELPKYGRGTQAIAKALGGLNLDQEITRARDAIAGSSKTEKDLAIRRLGFLKSAKNLGINPNEWMLTRAPVLPPAFRPISMMGNGMPLVSDPNYLYKELIEANDNYKTMRKEVGAEGAGPERLATYHAFKAVTGLGDPISQKSQDKGVRGILSGIFGTSPKFGHVQRKLISSTVDNVGRAVITPNPEYDMDTVGIPEEKAFDIYGKFLARRMRRNGMPLTNAMKHIRDKSELARKALVEEMEERPVFINRAPVLHKFGIMAFKPQLVKGDAMQVSPLIVKGFNADFDGDAMQYHVPSSAEAVKEAYERLLPSRSLISPADFKSPVHAPSNEYLGGLYHATTSKSKRGVRIFHSMADARKAYERGDISIDDPVKILGR